ncbi:MAG: dUTP diphosphatase [Bacteroidota bacterium]|nr:dUTP diphosphatase [Bacteroidota bacterium]MDX5428116.1 dUTP diphosphatase [Bacteroidota bacterium]MDX5447332.1 dUTP diphosphatase [Bacteroidota bacterium]MDX5505930.1 dUTP diphosphatase [Bacteroidota bacterium]
MKIDVINRSKHPLPQYTTLGAAGLDLRANLDSPIILEVGQRVLVKTGLFISVPQGYEAQVRPRSGLAYKHGVTVLNTPGTIDSDYRGEIGVILINHGQEAFEIKDGERVAQLVIAKHETIEWSPVETLEESERGSGGFGSTGRT